jgi:hypothetical protein
MCALSLKGTILLALDVELKIEGSGKILLPVILNIVQV